jgi:hypothetical protein
MQMRLFAALALAGALTACGGQLPLPLNPPAPSSAGGTAPATGTPLGPLQGLASFTVTDLQNALAIAKAGNDAAGKQCYAYLVPVVQQAAAQLGNPNVTVSGAFSAFETGRVAVSNIKGFVNGVPQGLNIACAPLVLDAGTTLVGLAAKAGIAIALPQSVAAGTLIPLP